jgi:hypothetical protein
MLLVAIPAVYRAALGGLERYLAILAAVGALGLVHLSGATEAPASLPVTISHVIPSLFRPRPRESRSLPPLPLRAAALPNHLHRWSVWEHIAFLVSKCKRCADRKPRREIHPVSSRNDGFCGYGDRALERASEPDHQPAILARRPVSRVASAKDYYSPWPFYS